MRDRTLIALVILLIVLSLGHDIDHMIRGDIRWQPVSAIVILVKYAFLSLGLFFYLKNKIGPLFWAIAAGIGVIVGWLAHFSPFTDQPPQYIFHAYQDPAAGSLAVALLAGFMLTMIIIAIYAEYLWARNLR
jgi:hypothetical protein